MMQYEEKFGSILGIEGQQFQPTPEPLDLRPAAPSKFLIANPGLGFCVNHRKQSPLKISNREYIAVFQSANLHPPLPNDPTATTAQAVGRAFRTAGILPALLQFPTSSLVTNHASLITRAPGSSNA
jgi:hypothetical protein